MKLLSIFAFLLTAAGCLPAEKNDDRTSPESKTFAVDGSAAPLVCQEFSLRQTATQDVLASQCNCKVKAPAKNQLNLRFESLQFCLNQNDREAKAKKVASEKDPFPEKPVKPVPATAAELADYEKKLGEYNEKVDLFFDFFVRQNMCLYLCSSAFKACTSSFDSKTTDRALKPIGCTICDIHSERITDTSKLQADYDSNDLRGTDGWFTLIKRQYSLNEDAEFKEFKTVLTNFGCLQNGFKPEPASPQPSNPSTGGTTSTSPGSSYPGSSPGSSK